MDATTPVAWGNITDKVLLALREIGPLTASELMVVSGAERQTIGSVLARLHKPVKRGKNVGAKRVHICGYRYHHVGARAYPRPVWALGDRQDAPRPIADQLAVKRRYWHRRKALLAA